MKLKLLILVAILPNLSLFGSIKDNLLKMKKLKTYDESTVEFYDADINN